MDSFKRKCLVIGLAHPYVAFTTASPKTELPTTYLLTTANAIERWFETVAPKIYSAIFLRDRTEPIQIKSRIELTKSLLPIPSKTFEVWSKGKSDLSKMLSMICIGDFTSVYHALMNEIDPTPVNIITQLKEKIRKYKIKDKILKELDTISNLPQK